MTYLARYDRIDADSTYHAVIKNNETDKDVVIEQILVINDDGATGNTTLMPARIERFTGSITGGSSQTVRNLDTSDAAPNVQLVSSATALGTVTDVLRRYIQANNVPAIALAGRTMGSYTASDINWQTVYYRNVDSDGLILHTGEGLAIINTVANSPRTTSYMIIFSLVSKDSLNIPMYLVRKTTNADIQFIFSMFNTSSTKKIQITRIWRINHQTASNLNAQREYTLYKTSTAGTGTSVGILKYDTNAPNVSDLTVLENLSANPTTTYEFMRYVGATNIVVTPGAGGSPIPIEGHIARNPAFQNIFGNRLWDLSGITKPLTLRQNEGIAIERTAATSPTELEEHDILVEFIVV